MIIKDNKKIGRILNDKEAKSEKVNLSTSDGKNFGTISAGAFSAIRGNYLDSYSPIDDNEKKVLNAYKNYAAEQAKVQAENEKQEYIKNTPALSRYNIDPDNFGYDDLTKWGAEHGQTVAVDATTMHTYLKPKYEGSFLGIGGRKLSTDQEDTDALVLERLAENNTRKKLSNTDLGKVMSGLLGVADSVSFGAIGAAADKANKFGYNRAGLSQDRYVSPSQEFAKTTASHPVANIAGNIAGSVASLGALGKGVGAATKGIKWISGSPEWVKNAINSGITFAISSGAETTFDGGDLGEVLKNAGINFVGGAVGGALSGKVGAIGEKVLFDKGLQHKIIPEMIRVGTSSAVFAGGKTGATYFLYPEDSRPSAEQMAKDIGVAFAFGAISSAVNTMQTSAQNKKYLDDLYKKMARDYEAMAKASVNSKDDVAGVRKFAKNVIGYSNVMEAYLTGKELNATVDGQTYTFTPNKVRLVGQDKYVQQILSEMQSIKGAANATLNGVNSPTTDIATTGETTPGTNTSPTPDVPAPPMNSTPNSAASPVAGTSQIQSTETAPETPESPSVPGIVPQTTQTRAVTPKVATEPSLSGELSDIAEADPVINFAPETASKEVKKLEEFLTAQGADDISRKESIDAALEIENAIAGTDKNVWDVFTDANGIARNATEKIKNKVGETSNFWRLFTANLKALRPGSSAGGAEIITEYAKAYTEALKNNNPEKYNLVFASSDGSDLSAGIPESIIKNSIPTTVKNAGAYKLAASHIKEITDDVISQISDKKAEIYVEKGEQSPASTDEKKDMSSPKNITLTQVGDFYEAYGDDAAELAKKLDLTLTSKTVNGERVQMTGFPVAALDDYKSALGGGVNIAVKNNASAPTEKQLNTVPESGIINTTNNNEGVISNDDTGENISENSESPAFDEGRTLGKDGSRHSEMQSSGQAENVLRRDDTGDIESGRQIRTDEGRYNNIEDRPLGRVAETESFETLARTVGNEIPASTLSNLAEKYAGDDRFELYDFSEVVTYDMLADSDNELRSLFGDNIAEYFSAGNIDVSGTDITGDKLSEKIINGTKHSVVKNKKGQLIPVYHGTDANYAELQPGDIGIHFGSYAQAVERARAKELNDPVIIKAYLNITNPVTVDKDFFGWNASQIAQELVKQDLITTDEGVAFIKEDRTTGNAKLRELLTQKGYDGIIYNNQIEASSGKSYVVFDNSQIFRAGVGNTAGNKKAPATTKEKHTVKRAKKADWQAHDVEWHALNGDTVIAYSTKAASDLIEALATDNPKMAISEIFDAINYDAEAKKVLQAYIDSGFGDSIASEHFVHNKKAFTEVQDTDTAKDDALKNEKNDVGTLTDKCEIVKTKHTKTGKDLWVVTLKDRISQSEFNELRTKVKEAGGYYSPFAKTPEGKAIPGFIFEKEPDSKAISAFNDFFGETEESVENNIKESAKNDIPESSVLAGESKPDGRGLRSGASGPDERRGTEGVDRPDRQGSGEVLQRSALGETGGRDDGNAGTGIHGADDGRETLQKSGSADTGDPERGRRRGELLGGGDSTLSGVGGQSEESGRLTENPDKAPQTIETGEKAIAKKHPSNKNNFVITDNIAKESDSALPSAEDNIEAMELLLKLENEGRAATSEEKTVLARYKGWGGIDTRYMSYDLTSRFNKLFDYEQRRAMQSSQNNAFFTPTKVIDSVYNGLKRMGFKGGNVLEPSMGTGNFFGRMPAAMSAKSALTGVELESYTARIAQYLYPGATVINKPFQDVVFKNGAFDLVVGNVPFGQNKISYNKKKYSLHNYFIISSLDKVRDGGIVAVITSAGTLDSYGIDSRAAIMDKADVVACYKLPEKVFSKNANTDVQSDLLILRKRANGEKPKGDSILNVKETNDGLRLNEYFIKHPENILGTLAKGSNAWGEVTTVLNTGDFYERLDDAMKKLPKDIISGKSDLKPVETIVSLSDKPRFFEKNGAVYSDDGAGTATKVAKNQVDTVRDYITVRDAYKELLNAYDMDLSEEEIKPLRDSLAKTYDEFYKKHGAITGDGKKKIGSAKSKNNTFLESDSDYYLVSGLENYDAKNKKFTKSTLFEKDTLRKKKVTSVDSPSDALAVALNETGKVDFSRMSELTGKNEDQLVKELDGEIVFTPEGHYELTDIYLSGNIYEKLDAVKDKPEFAKQKEMLEKVIPAPKDASEITVKLGANYIDPKYIERFAREVLNTSLTIKKDVSGRWVIDGVRQSRYGDVVNVKYGCEAFNAVQLLEKVLNDGEITATKKIKDGSNTVTVFDPKMTDVARQKADDIRAAFQSWIFSDGERRNDIVAKYNRLYNNFRPLDFGRIAEKLSFDSMSGDLKNKLYPHQKKGIARFVFGGNILFAHGVGTGKTFEMIASVMEAKRMGIINKAAMVVPNNKVVDFKRDILQAYPSAKVLVVDTANKKRQTMLGLVNSNDWDIVLIARTTFTKIPVSKELQANYAAQQLEDIERQISEAEGDRNVSRRQLKGLITQRDNYEQKLKDLNSDTKRDENGIDFEKLGIDCICVDEAHNYKSIMTPTKLDIKGLVNKNNAQMANDMLMKLDYLRSIDGRIIFGTGTPITNTVSEIYNMMRMVRPDVLENAGIHSLDEWVNTFAKIESTTEIGIDNQIKTKAVQTIRSFVNASEMIGMFRQFADVVFTEDVVKDLPKAVYKDIEIEATEEHREIQEQISKTLAKSSKQELLKTYGQLMSMADVASVDLRMLSGADSDVNVFKDYSLEELEHENSKINTMCDIVLDEYEKSNNIKGTQIIFCDKGSGSGTVYSFNLHKDIMQKLIDRGIPKDEIVIIKNQNDAQLEALYEKVNEGEVRVIIGTSQKMAEGLNVQKRVVAIHHPTVTYKPSDWEQGNARGVRSGNINKEVRIYRYLQKSTFDSHKWQAQDRKGQMIRTALRGDAISEMEDIGADDEGGAGIDAATAMAITSGNPLVREKIDIDKEVTRLKTLKQNHMGEVYRYQDAIAKNPALISQLSTRAENIRNDIALRNKDGEKPVTVIKGKRFEKQSDANKALTAAVSGAPKNGKFSKLGTYGSFDIMFKGDTGGMNYSLALKGGNEYQVEYAGSGNNIARMAGVLKRLDADLDKLVDRVETLKTDLEFAKKEIEKPFEKEAELEKALEKQKDVTYRYEHYNEKTTPDKDGNSGNDSDSDTYSSKDTAGTDADERWKTERVNEGKDNNITLAQIVEEIRKRFEIPISTGKVTDRSASGIYKEKAEAIRTRIANNLPTISHELGHHLEKMYSFSGLESVKSLRGAVSDDFLKQYPPEKRTAEAIAEFVRIYLKNTEEAKKLCPEFYDDFTSKLLPGDLDAVNGIASMVNEYLSYGTSKRFSSAITSSAKKEKMPFRDKWSQFYTDWVDQFHPMKEVMDYVEDVTEETASGKRNAYKLATNSLNAHSIANFLVSEGFRDLGGKLLDKKSLIDSISMVDSKDLNILDEYLVLRHSLEWIAPQNKDVRVKRVFGDDTLEDVGEIKSEIGRIESEHPEIKEAAENLYEYQRNILEYFAVQSGLMTSEMFDKLWDMYPDYVPFYRAVGKRSGYAKGTFANQKSPIMRAKGSGEQIISPMESIIRNTEKIVKASLRNQVATVWANIADNVEGFGQFIEKVPPDMIPSSVNIEDLKERFNDILQHEVKDGDDYFAVSELLDEIFGDSVTSFTPTANARKRIIAVMKDGRPSYYQVHDEALYKSIAEMPPKQISGLLAISQKIMQPMKLLITQNNPIFAVTNALRDIGTAYKLSPINNPVTFAKLYVDALSKIITSDEMYKQYKAMGGGHSSELSANIDNISKTLRRVAEKDSGMARRLGYAIFLHPVDTVAAINDAVESVPRLMEFIRTLEAGGDLQDAIYNADDITSNFKRSGSGATAKAANKLVMFNNAAIQGIDKLVRTLGDKAPEKRRKLLLKWALHALLVGVIGYIYNKTVDEEGYENLSSYKKNNFYNFAIGDGKFISIPKPRENALLDSLTERTMEYFVGENKEAFYNFGEYVASQLLPPMLPDTLNPINALHSVVGNTVLGGLFDIGFNMDFKGSPIESDYDKYLPSNERYDDTTSKLAYGLGQTKLARAWDLSPKKIDHLLSQYTGILQQVNKALFPINDERRDMTVGLRNKFISDSNYSTDVLNKMYENKDKAKKAFDYSSSIDDAVRYEQNAIITSYISGMNKAVKALPDDQQRGGRAYLLSTLNAWDYDETSSQKTMKSRLKGMDVSDKYIVESVPGSVLEWSEDKVKYYYQMTPKEYAAYTKDYLTLIEKYRKYQSNKASSDEDYVSALKSTGTEVTRVLNKKYKNKFRSVATKTKK